jgi:hypothetical protein
MSKGLNAGGTLKQVLSENYIPTIDEELLNWLPNPYELCV